MMNEYDLTVFVRENEEEPDTSADSRRHISREVYIGRDAWIY